MLNMRSIVVVFMTYLYCSTITVLCRPAVEVEKQHLIHISGNMKFGNNPPINNEKSAEEILRQINKINVELGYIKKSPSSMVINPLLQHFYVKSLPSLPIHFKRYNEMIHNNNNNAARSISHHNYRKSRLSSDDIKINRQYPLLIDKNVITIIDYPPEYLEYLVQNNRHGKHKFIDNRKEYRKTDNLKKPESNVIVIGRSVDSKINKTETTTVRKQNRNSSDKINRTITTASIATTTTSTTTGKPIVEHMLESRVSSNNKFTNQTENFRLFFKAKPVAPKERDSTTTSTTSTPLPTSNIQENESGEESEETEKGPFGILFNKEKETAVEALKQGGVIIKRLRVRNGGIAIAGPGGVATAGSGGTAIVGPGGIALTHPRSLTIAGPGARVFSVPKTTDLETLALQSGRNFADDGVIVATGPIIYYSSP